MARHCTQGTQTMNAPISPPLTFRTFADLQRRLGDVAPERIRMQPAPGTATKADVVRATGACELVDGVLVEKAVGAAESSLAGFLFSALLAFVAPRRLGRLFGEHATLEILPGVVREPDVSFVAYDRLPGRRMPTEPVPRIVPNLAVEILSVGNRPGEMAVKRQEYFAAGVELVWEIDPRARTVAVHTSPADETVLQGMAVLDGGSVLPSFQLPLPELFAYLDD